MNEGFLIGTIGECGGDETTPGGGFFDVVNSAIDTIGKALGTYTEHTGKTPALEELRPEDVSTKPETTPTSATINILGYEVPILLIIAVVLFLLMRK